MVIIQIYDTDAFCSGEQKPVRVIESKISSGIILRLGILPCEDQDKILLGALANCLDWEGFEDISPRLPVGVGLFWGGPSGRLNDYYYMPTTDGDVTIMHKIRKP